MKKIIDENDAFAVILVTNHQEAVREPRQFKQIP